MLCASTFRSLKPLQGVKVATLDATARAHVTLLGPWRSCEIISRAACVEIASSWL